MTGRDKHTNLVLYRIATISKFYPNLIFAGKAKSLPSFWSPIRRSILVGCGLAQKYRTMVDMTGKVQLSSLLQYIIATISIFHPSLISAGNA